MSTLLPLFFSGKGNLGQSAQVLISPKCFFKAFGYIISRNCNILEIIVIIFLKKLNFT